MTAPPAATPFSKVLIANRGEIALRVMRTAHALGYRTVAVYSEADSGARHVMEADRAVCIGGPLPGQSYLNVDAIIAAARRCGADAVHPGYGFLAEHAGFARACRDAGLVFIGPSPESIDAMGDKAGAKRLMRAAGVPCIPGYEGEDQGEPRLADEAARIGYPVMIKATAGGGGRGMRLVASAAGFADALRSARSEARGAFGHDGVILERALAAPRHIEIQVVADRHGHAIHLGERDCSVQRRHQKLIEEAPSPAVSADLRERMGAAAVAAVRAIGYEGVGTLEFLLDASGEFHFMEMNTRLQVEHPVTEAITGLDLVELQLRIASGEPLALAQQEVRFEGHAIEVRLCAEDSARSFMPQSGTMLAWRMPPSLRAEHALAPGAAIPPFYDSMIAKLIAHGHTRDEARRRLTRGLDDVVALGVTTNQSFLARCLSHPVFASGGATTAFIETHADALLAAPPSDRAAAIAAVLLVETARAPGWDGRGRRRLHHLPVVQRLRLQGREVDVALVALGQRRYSATVGEVSVDLDVVELGDQTARVACDGVLERVPYHRYGDVLWLLSRGEATRVEDATRAATARRGGELGDGQLRATMNGRVVALWVASGDHVQAGQPVLTLEAMKMEHVHAAPRTGTVAELLAQVGEQVAAGRVLARIDTAAGEAP